MSLPFDHRLVQTGVIGHKDSDEPIILPMEAHELEHWHKQRPPLPDEELRAQRTLDVLAVHNH